MQSITVTIMGAGNVGANCAHFLCEQELAESIYLFDIDEGRATGKALDMREALPVRRRRSRVLSITDFNQVRASDIIIFALGNAPDKRNAPPRISSSEIIMRYATQLTEYTGVVILNGDDSANEVREYINTSGTAAARVLGIGTLPHTLALRIMLARATGLSAEQCQGLVVGSEMAPRILDGSLNVSGIPLEHFIDHDRAADSNALRAVRDIQQLGTLGYYTYASALAEIVSAITSHARKILTITSAAYGDSHALDNPLSLPFVIGRHGVSSALFADRAVKELAHGNK